MNDEGANPDLEVRATSGWGEDMRRPVFLIALTLAAVLMSAGVALAASIKCDGGTCRGTNRIDTMTGSTRVDRMYGFGGNDKMGGGHNNDLLVGGGGSETMNGSFGFDTLYGNDFADTISGGPANDEIYAGPGTDTVYGGTGNDYVVIAGDGQNDSVNCGTGNDDTLVLDLQELGGSNLIEYAEQTSCEKLRVRR